MDLYAHDDLWPLFYTGRCRAVPMPALTPTGHAIPWLGYSAIRSNRAKRELIFITRVILTTVAALTTQDTKDAGFVNTSELIAYLRQFNTSLGDETPIFLAHFTRVIEGEKHGQ